MKRPRYTAQIRDRATGAVVTLEYETLEEMAAKFGRILEALAEAVK